MMVWNKKSLKDLIREKIGDHKFIVVSNREPYIHNYDAKGIQCITPASGMAVALNPVMMACGGTWIASGTGDADKEVVDEKDHIQVPPDNPKYALRRVWLSREDLDGFYYGYSNEGLWPLCHIVHVRPTFRETDWEKYKKVNQRFADVVLEELGEEKGFVFIQDYHFALLSRMIKERREDVVIAQFWHIPWPNPEALRVCPHAEEILLGLLSNDIMGFHIRYHCLNFIDSLDRFLEVRVDWERLSVFKGGLETLVRPFPISIDVEMIENIAESKNVELRKQSIRNDHRVKGRFFGLGIDRLDYTKGIIERFLAIDRFLEKYPEYIGKFVFFQLGPLSRIRIPKYQEYNDEIYHTMIRINEKWREKNWQPILLQKSHLSLEEVIGYYRAADFCIVSSVHDGMNLVAKEFVASRTDNKGILILSKFTGAARELEGALLVNPIAVEEFAAAIKQSLEMSENEIEERMKKMREVVRENNVYRWAGKIVSEMKKLL
jgi:trehalose-6-phosphate synthase